MVGQTDTREAHTPRDTTSLEYVKLLSKTQATLGNTNKTQKHIEQSDAQTTLRIANDIQKRKQLTIANSAQKRT